MKDNYIIGCDPSTKQLAFAIYENKKLIEYCKVESKFNEISKFFIGFRDKNYILGIENQYMHLNILTLMKLVEIRTTVVTLAQVNNCKEVFLISPQSWQNTILGMSNHQKREQRKAVAKMVASEITKTKITDSDIADAICIANYLFIFQHILKNKDAI